MEAYKDNRRRVILENKGKREEEKEELNYYYLYFNIFYYILYNLTVLQYPCSLVFEITDQKYQRFYV